MIDPPVQPHGIVDAQMAWTRTQRVAVLAAAAVFVVGWTRFAWQAARSPSPPRYPTFLGDTTSMLPHCWGAAFSDGESIWRVCGYSDSLEITDTGLVRFDLARNVAEMRWRFPTGTRHPVRGLAKREDGHLAVVLFETTTDSLVVYDVDPAGGMRALPLPAEAVGTLVQLRWEPAGLSLVLAERGEATRWSLGTDWSSKALPAPPPVEGATHVLAMSYRLPRAWRYLWAALPADATAGPVVFQLYEEDEGNVPGLAGKVTLELNAEDAVLASKGYLHLPFDRAPGNVTNLFGRISQLPPLSWNGKTWAPLALPAGLTYDRVDLEADFRMVDGALIWAPRYWVHTPAPDGALPEVGRAARVGDRWLGIVISERGQHLRDVETGVTGPPVTDDNWLTDMSNIFPSRTGGFDVLGAYGTHVRVSSSLVRADALRPDERIAHLFTRFRIFAPFNDFYLEVPWLKQAVLPILLLLFPFGLGAAWMADRRRSPRRVLTSTCVAYVVFAGLLGPWFWRLTERV